jgi:hypothetical protein
MPDTVVWAAPLLGTAVALGLALGFFTSVLVKLR